MILLTAILEEHHISNLDPGAFFSLHDYDYSATWTPEEIRRTYGLNDESTKDVSEEKREQVVKGVMDLFDEDQDGAISREEWLHAWTAGRRLPDFGVCFPFAQNSSRVTGCRRF